MTQYIVHIYREMRLTFADIEADTPEAAAAFARDKATDEADDIEDCNGEDLSALVDQAGDEEYRHSVTIDFEAERHRKAAGKLLAALRLCHEQLSVWVADTETCDLSPEDEDALAKAADAIAEADAAGVLPADIQAILAERREIAVGWSVEDVQEIRPDLTAEQAWEVLQAAERGHDATVGINWEVLECYAEHLFGDAPETDDAGEE